MGADADRSYEANRAVSVEAPAEAKKAAVRRDVQRAKASRQSRKGQARDIRKALAAEGDDAGLVQRRAAGPPTEDPAAVHAAAARGVAGGGERLPHLDAIQRAFGPHDVSGVQAHVGGAAAEASAAMGAQGYATGGDVAFAQSPDLHTAAHEAAHVVQQRGGVSLKGGVGQAGDSYERHADAVADRVVQGHSAVDLLDQMADGAAGGAVQRRVVQRESKKDSSSTQTGEGGGEESKASVDDLVKAVSDAETRKAREKAVDGLTTWCRANLIDSEKLQQYLARTDIDDKAKTKLLGELRVEIARNEMLLGWAHRGGVDKGGSAGWETTKVKKTSKEGVTTNLPGRNKGPFPDHYLGTVGMNLGPQPWCTSFAGETHLRLGFSAGERDKSEYKSEKGWKSANRSMFWSGYRLRKWSTEGEDTQRRTLTPEKDTIKSGSEDDGPGEGGDLLIRQKDWKALRKAIKKAPAKKRGALVDKALKGRLPQPGDVVVRGKNNDFTGEKKSASHTMLVESYDAKTHTLYTIEGNTNNAARGGKYVLTDPKTIAMIIFLVRVGADFFQKASATEQGGEGASGGDGDATGTEKPRRKTHTSKHRRRNRKNKKKRKKEKSSAAGAELVTAAKAINQKIAKVAQSKGWVKGDSPDDLAHELSGGGDTEGASVR